MPLHTTKWQWNWSISLLVKTFKNIVRVRIWGNPRTTSNLNCLFSLHNWKWINLSKMAGLNISSQQFSSNLAQLKLMSRSVFPLPFVFPTLYSFLHRQRNKQNYSTQISRMLFTFFRRKTLWKNLFSLHVCETASAYKWQEFWH